MTLVRRAGLVLAGSLLLAGAHVGCGGEPSRPRDVLLITVDTLRADALGCYGHAAARTPNIDALAAAGARFTQAFTPRGVTLPALTTINTGVSCLSHGVLGQSEALPAELPTLAQTLGPAGWQCAAFITNICEVIVALEDHVGRGYQTRECTRVASQPQWEWDRRATDAALGWLDAAPADQPALLWVHYMDPHGTHQPRRELIAGPPPLDFMEKQDEILYRHEVDGITPPPERLDALWQLYDAEIAGVDLEVGRLLQAWRARRGTDGVIVFVADHGEELFDHDNFNGHGDSVFDSVLRVPLIVAAPGAVAPGQVCESVVELEDIAPTIVQLLGQPPVGTHEGVSLLPAVAPGGPPPELRGEFENAFGSRFREVLTIRTKRWRYIWNLKFGELEKRLIEEHRYRKRFSFFRNEEQLYDLDADPRELHNLLGGDQVAEAAERARDGLRTELVRWLGTRMKSSEAQRSVGNEKLYEELKANGYLEFVPEQYR